MTGKKRHPTTNELQAIAREVAEGGDPYAGVSDDEIRRRRDEMLPCVLPAGWKRLGGSWDTDDGAAFVCRSGLRVIASLSYPEQQWWWHVSCSFADKMPSYAILREVKDLFIGRDRVAIEVFANSRKHVNIHPYCRHLWTRLDGATCPDFTHGGRTI